MNTKTMTLKYALIQAFYWMNFAPIFSYSSVFLLERGFSNTEIGLLVGIAGILAALLQPPIAGMIDKNGGRSLPKTVTVIVLAAIALAALLIFTPVFAKPAIALLYGAVITMYQLLLPFIFSLGTGCINAGINLNFGVARGGGSILFALTSLVIGRIIVAIGPGCLPYFIVGLFAILLPAVLTFPYPDIAPAKLPEKGRTSEKQAPFLRRYPVFAVLLIGCTLLFIGHNMINNFLYQIVSAKGGNSAEMGVVTAVCSLAELPPLFMFVCMVKKARCDTWLKISGVFFTVKILATFLVPNVLGMYFVQVFQAPGFALFTVSSVYYVNSITKPGDSVKGQAYMTMTNTIGAVLAAVAGGAFIDRFGMSSTLAILTVVSAVGTAIMLFTAKKAE